MSEILRQAFLEANSKSPVTKMAWDRDYKKISLTLESGSVFIFDDKEQPKAEDMIFLTKAGAK
jgi:hypothetical protein